MTMKKKIFVAIASLAASVAIVVVSVFATVAYLTSSAAVSNVFTIGNVGITMDESKVNPDGTVVTDGGRVDTNTYHLVPNKKYTKDPVIHVNSGSENSYLFVLVRNDLEKIEIVSDSADEMTIAEQLAASGWGIYTTASTGKVYVYGTVDASGNVTTAASVNPGDYKLFEYFMTDPSAKIDTYGAAKITLTAVAIQVSGFGEEGSKAALDKAWEAIIETYPYIHTGGTTNSGSSSSASN